MGVLALKILGPLGIQYGDRPVPVRGAREQAVLAVLLLEAGHVVPLARLVEAVWDNDPPQAAKKAVRNIVSVLRGRLAQTSGFRGLIETSPFGYRLQPDGYWLDAADFSKRAAAARALTRLGRSGEAVAEFRAALGLWRGPALAGIGGLLIEAAAARLDEQRLAACEECLDLELSLGRHREVTDELLVLASEHPLRERLAGQLMLALYRAGRQAEALDTYHRLAKRLSDDLGLDPSREITRLHEAVLGQDPELEVGRVSARQKAGESLTGTDSADSGITAQPRPAQLPLDVPGFIGRATELARLHALLPTRSPGDPQPDTATVVISAIGGTAGIGKTALAVRFAHRVAGRFPDGQLYVNLRGFGPSGPPVTTGEALSGFLRALGMAAASIPTDTAEQAALYRSLLADKRVLILLDNAHDAAQARPLLPASPGCLVIITSRSQLTGLIAAEGARMLTLDVLSGEEAADLLANRLGPDRLKDDPGAAGELTALCSGLPLALAIVAARAVARPELGLAGLAAELREARSRLDALDTGDPPTSLRAVFSWSYRKLSEPQAQMFRRLGLHVGPDVTAPAAASLADIPLADACALLGSLTDAHLLTERTPGRFALHDLLRAYAAELAMAPAEAGELRAAQGRLFDHYLATAATAMDMLHPAEAHSRPRVPPPGTRTPGLTDPRAALAWLDAERPSLVAFAAHAGTHGWPAHAIQLAATLDRYLQGGHYTDALAIHAHARTAAHQAGDHDTEASALCCLGVIYWRLGRYTQAADHLQQALTLYRRTGNQRGLARALDDFGAVERHLGDHLDAIRHSEQALTLFREVGDRVGETITLINLGDALSRLGRNQQAAEHLHEALVLSRHNGNRNAEAHVLTTLGEVEQRSGQPEQAAQHHRQALDLFQELGHRFGQAWALTNLGTACATLGQPEQADGKHQHALALFRDVGDREGEAAALNGLGETARATDHPADALPHHTAALTLALGTGIREQQACAHAGLARSYDALGQPAQAREHWQHALDLYIRIASPEADQIRTHLAAQQQNQASRATP